MKSYLGLSTPARIARTIAVMRGGTSGRRLPTSAPKPWRVA